LCNFNKQNEETKALIHLFMKKSAENLGGVNFLLNLLESIKTNKPNALIIKEKKVTSKEATIEWNKVIFKDKFDVLEDIIHLHSSKDGTDFNILDTENMKKKKKILNMAKTLAPIEFLVIPKENTQNGGFSFKVFETIEDDYIKLNPIFVAIFFCSVEFTKKALKFKL